MTIEPSAMGEAELEQHIHDCGRHMLQAMANNNREEAEGWLQAQMQAIQARSPETKQRMEQAIMQRIHEPCYFDAQGEAARQELQGRRAA